MIAFGGGFHGRTYMAMALTGKVSPYKVGFGPFPGDVYHVPYPVTYHGVTSEDSLAALDQLRDDRRVRQHRRDCNRHWSITRATTAAESRVDAAPR